MTGRPSAGAPRESGVSGGAHAHVCGSRNRPYIPEIDTSTAHVARVYDYMLGGVNNFEVDRLAAERSAEPAGGIEAWRHSSRSNRAFLGRVVR